jgi:hypothetical protein
MKTYSNRKVEKKQFILVSDTGYTASFISFLPLLQDNAEELFKQMVTTDPSAQFSIKYLLSGRSFSDTNSEPMRVIK